jgi:ABC-type antimicrobial peptide transport system permease subunit
MALGARPSAIVAMISREVAALLAVGLIAGVSITLASTRLLEAMLFGVKASDWLVIAAASAVIGLAALTAAVIPSRRAASVSPITALRYD